MALIKCPECSSEISDKAKACPKCGCPIKEDVHFTEKEHRATQSIKDGMNYAVGGYIYRTITSGIIVIVCLFVLIGFVSCS